MKKITPMICLRPYRRSGDDYSSVDYQRQYGPAEVCADGLRDWVFRRDMSYTAFRVGGPDVGESYWGGRRWNVALRRNRSNHPAREDR